MYFVDTEKAFDRVPRKVIEWTMRKKGLPEVIVGAAISPATEQKRKLEWDLSYLKNFW